MRMLEGKKALVTGGSRGIGAQVVQNFMEEGAEVAFTFHHNAEVARELSEQMITLCPGQRCLALQCDVTDTNGMRDVIKAVTLEFGRIDVLVNNAGIAQDTAFARMSREQWDTVIATNLGGTFNATQPL